MSKLALRILNAAGDGFVIPLEDGGSISVDNLPGDYPLPAGQLEALTPQKDALTDEQLRATPVPVVTGLTQPTTPSDTQPVSGTVAVSNQISQPLTYAQLRSSAVDVADAGEREYTHATAEVTASGDTTIHTPASGKRIRLWWIYALNDPASDNPRLITIKIGADEKFKTFGISKRQKITGDVDAPLVVNLSGEGSVAVTAIFEEID